MDHSVHESLSHQKEQKNINFSTVPNKKFENQKLENVLGWELWRYTSLLMSKVQNYPTVEIKIILLSIREFHKIQNAPKLKDVTTAKIFDNSLKHQPNCYSLLLKIVLATERGSHNSLKRLKHFYQHLKKIHCHLRLLLLAIKSWKCNFGVIWSLIPAVFRRCGYTFWNTKKCQCGTKCNNI